MSASIHFLRRLGLVAALAFGAVGCHVNDADDRPDATAVASTASALTTAGGSGGSAGSRGGTSSAYGSPGFGDRAGSPAKPNTTGAHDPLPRLGMALAEIHEKIPLASAPIGQPTGCNWTGQCVVSTLATATCPAFDVSTCTDPSGGGLYGCVWSGASGCTAPPNSTCNNGNNDISETACTGTSNACVFWTGNCGVSQAALTNCPQYSTSVGGSQISCTTVANAQWGCTWDPGTSTCNPPTTCGVYTTEATCDGNPGCAPGPACTTDGGACNTAANNASAAACGSLAACTFAGGCNPATTLECLSNSGSTAVCNAPDSGCAMSADPCTSNAAVCASASSCTGACAPFGACVSQCTGTSQTTCSSPCLWSGGAYVGSGWEPFPGVGVWGPDMSAYVPDGGGAGTFPSDLGYLNAGFGRGSALAQWFAYTGGVSPFAVNTPKFDLYETTGASSDFVYGWEYPGAPANAALVDASTPFTQGGPSTVWEFTFDTPIGFSATSQTGRVMYADMHMAESLQVPDASSMPYVKVAASINDGGQQVPIFNTSPTGPHECIPSDAGVSTLNEQERVGEFFIFDLGACAASGLPPPITAPHWYASETYTRDYCEGAVGQPNGCTNLCPPNEAVVWRKFEFGSYIPPGPDDGGTWNDAGPSIVFQVQTGSVESELGESEDAGGSAVYTLYNDTVSTQGLPAANGCPANMICVDVKNVIPASYDSLTWLRVSMTLNPDYTHQFAPVLNSWAQVYDCVPSQ